MAQSDIKNVFRIAAGQAAERNRQRAEIARDKVRRRIDLFLDSNIAEFADVLDGDEIRQMIIDRVLKGG